MPRGEAHLVLGVSERSPRSDLKELRLAFPLNYGERLFPNLFTASDPAVPAPPVVPKI